MSRSENVKKTQIKMHSHQITREDVEKFMSRNIENENWAEMAEKYDTDQSNNFIAENLEISPFAELHQISNETKRSRRKAKPSKRSDFKPRFTRSKDAKERQKCSEYMDRKRDGLGLKHDDKVMHNGNETVKIPCLLEINTELPLIRQTRNRMYVSPTSTNNPKSDTDKTPIKHENTNSPGLRRSPRKRTQAQANICTPILQLRGTENNVTPKSASRPVFTNRANSVQPELKKKKSSLTHSVKNEAWVVPKCGWVDENSEEGRKKIQQRQKELDKAYDKEVYKRYSNEVARKDRIKGIHPVTPNKFINYSRRSWDVMVKNWRKEIHIFMNESYSDCTSLNTSFCASSSGSEKGISPMPKADISPETTPEIQRASVPKKIRDLNDPNDLASILGHYDIDSHGGDESTLKAHTMMRSYNKGPIDFSILQD